MFKKVKNWKGCRGCELSKKQIDCRAFTENVKLKFTKDEKWDNWGRMVVAFRKGTVIKGTAVIKDGKVYCASAESPIYEGISDFVGLDNVEVFAQEEL